MVAMNFGITDDKLVSYLQRFNENGSAFILKPKELRYKVIKTKEPKEQTVNPMETIKTTLCDSDNMPQMLKKLWNVVNKLNELRKNTSIFWYFKINLLINIIFN